MRLRRRATLGAEFTKVYANAHGSQRAARAQQATEATAAAAQAGTGPAPASTPPASAADVPDYGSLVRPARAREEIDRRAQVAQARLLQQVVVFAVTTLASLLFSRRKRKKVRRAIRRTA